MPRLAVIPPEKMSREQRKVYEESVALGTPNGTSGGPYTAYLEFPFWPLCRQRTHRTNARRNASFGGVCGRTRLGLLATRSVLSLRRSENPVGTTRGRFPETPLPSPSARRSILKLPMLQTTPPAPARLLIFRGRPPFGDSSPSLHPGPE